jgi:hypothetical protein
MLKRLHESGIPELFSDLIGSLLLNNFFSVVIDGRKGNFFSSNTGLGEGSGLSPVLFFLFFFEFLRVRLDSLGVRKLLIVQQLVSYFFFADDLLLLAYSQADLQILMD